MSFLVVSKSGDFSEAKFSKSKIKKILKAKQKNDENKEKKEIPSTEDCAQIILELV